MNREQYLAKRMRLCGTPPDAGGIAFFDARSNAEVAATPAVSLVDHYRRLHACIARTAAENKPN